MENHGIAPAYLQKALGHGKRTALFFIACRLPKLRKTPSLVVVTMLQAAAHDIHFKRILNFGEGRVGLRVLLQLQNHLH
jgi:hypothetical protein